MGVTQPVRGGIRHTKNGNKQKPRRKPTAARERYRNRQQYGTSKLEQYFAAEYLDKLGFKYIYEYRADDIGRFYDFAITTYDNVPFITEEKHGINCIKQDGQNVPISFRVEIDGGYWHGDPRFVKNGKLSRMQKHNKMVDAIKDAWCERHGYPLLRFWEYDVRNNPKMVIDKLNVFMTEGQRRRRIDELKKRPH